MFNNRSLLTSVAAVLVLPATVSALFHYGRVDCPSSQFCIPPDCVPGLHNKFDVILPIGQGCDAALGPGVVANRDGNNRIVGKVCGVSVTITPGVGWTGNGQSGQCFSYASGPNNPTRCMNVGGGGQCVFADSGWCNSGICGP